MHNVVESLILFEFCFERDNKKPGPFLYTWPDQFEISKTFVRIFLALGNMRRFLLLKYSS